MTTMSMNANLLTHYGNRTVRFSPPDLKLPALNHAAGLVSDWCLEHALDMIGGLALALLPFSGLAWIFIAG